MSRTLMTVANVGSGYYGPALYRPEDITVLAQKVFELYDKDKTGHLGLTEVSGILVDLYRSVNKNFAPSKMDLETFTKKLDFNRDGIVTRSDLESCIRKFMKAEPEYIKTTSTSYSTSRLL